MHRLMVENSAVVVRSRETRVRALTLYVAGCLAGALGALVPTGIADLRGGLGLVGGIIAGIVASAAVSPALMTAIVSRQIAGDYQSGFSTAMYLGGLPRLEVHLGAMLASLREWGRVTVGAAVGGACVGLGDGIRGSEAWGWDRVSFTLIVSCLAVMAYVGFIASAMAIMSRRPLVTIVVPIASLIVGVLIVPILSDVSPHAVELSTWLPLQPLLVAVPAPVLGRYSTGAAMTDALPVVATWLTVCSLVWAMRRA